MNFDGMTREQLLEILNSQQFVDKVAGVSQEYIGAEEGEDEWSDSHFSQLCAQREEFMKLDAVAQATAARWADIEALREHYAVFGDFLYDCMTELLGFTCTEIQQDIGEFLASEVQYGMVQAQRSQAKSTIAAIYGVWTLIHNCRQRVLIVSAGSDVASEIANWVIQIIMNWDILECMRPDRQHGDRASVKAFDIHWQLKGPEKSPSVACIGITANMQGRRADLLLADDIESSKNGMTELQRAVLEHLTKDFTSICQTGRIIYLGTPQTSESIYNNLSGRGYTIRIWPGRYPTRDEERFYGPHLAPLIRKRMEQDESLRSGGGVLGDRGKPTDPQLLGEERLCAKERDQGTAYFNLQHMLNTELSDDSLYPLKTRNLIVMRFANDRAPGDITWLPSVQNKISVPGHGDAEFYGPFSVAQETYEFEARTAYIDPAGGGKNGDETVVVACFFLHGYMFIPEILKLPGGYEEEKYVEVCKFLARNQITHVDIEQNFGFGAYKAGLQGVMNRYFKEIDERRRPALEDVWETGQKELRIIETVEPAFGRHKVVIHTDVLEYDYHTTLKYPAESRKLYSLVYQIQKITRRRKALIHDDSIDAFAGAIRRWVNKLNTDAQQRMEQKHTDENVDFFKEWGANIGRNRADMGNMLNMRRKLTRRIR